LDNLFSLVGIEAWKPVLTALLLPPVPMLLLVLAGARLLLPRRGLGWLLVVLGTAGIWLGACAGMGDLLTRTLLHPPPPLGGEQIAQLRDDVKARQPVTIVVLGGGREARAPEYGTANLTHSSLERLRYGVWLGRETGASVGFTGGRGWGRDTGPPEAEIAERVAAKDFGLPLKWIEDQSRDTRENALRTVALLKRSGVKRAVLVTHGWHMPRAVRLFEGAAAGQIEIIAAPMGLALLAQGPVLDWLPSAEGFTRVRQVTREWLGRLAGD
jgi:uncharacterized SAM-binding protein YcdF (DUF218 family)